MTDLHDKRSKSQNVTALFIKVQMYSSLFLKIFRGEGIFELLFCWN